jgi:hypothetical protein
LPCHCADKAVNIYSFPLQNCRVSLLLLRQHRGVAGNGLGTTIKYLRRTASGAAGNGLGTTIKPLRQTTSGAAGCGLGTTIKYLRGAASIGLGTTAKYLRCKASAAAESSLGTTIKYLWGSEFTTKAAALQGDSAEVAPTLNFKGGIRRLVVTGGGVLPSF